MVGTHEPLIAHGAREPFLAGVRAQMPLQLVRPREPFAAEQPIANEGTFARVPSKMRFQVRSLAVHFSAAGYVTAVHVLLEVAAGRAQALSLLAVGTVTRGPSRVPALRARRRRLRRGAVRGRHRGRRSSRSRRGRRGRGRGRRR